MAKGLERAYSVSDLAEWSSKSTRFWYGEIHGGRLKARRIGISLRVLESDLQRYLDEQRNTGPSPARSRRGARRE